jgi:hypothetical protein
MPVSQQRWVTGDAADIVFLWGIHPAISFPKVGVAGNSGKLVFDRIEDTGQQNPGFTGGARRWCGLHPFQKNAQSFPFRQHGLRLPENRSAEQLQNALIGKPALEGTCPLVRRVGGNREAVGGKSGAAPSTVLRANARRRFRKLGKHRAICDYLAGMTDRYALLDHARIFGPQP